MTCCMVGLKMGLLLFVLPYILFFFSPDFSSKTSPQPFKIETSNLVKRFATTIYYGHSPICSSLPFSFFPDFLSKISPQLFKIETLNLV